MSARPSTGGEPRPDIFARFLSAVPLLVLYFALAALYAWQASRRPVPTIFTDELELTQLARAIAETGEPARRGVQYDSIASLVAYVLAPVWWLGSATESWATAKLILVLAMTATIFPAYGLARMVVPKWYALGRFSPITTRCWPRCRPASARPHAIARTSAASSLQLSVCQMPKSFSRNAGAAGRRVAWSSRRRGKVGDTFNLSDEGRRAQAAARQSRL